MNEVPAARAPLVEGLILCGPRTPRLWTQPAFNYLIPLTVASLSAAASRCRQGGGA